MHDSQFLFEYESRSFRTVLIGKGIDFFLSQSDRVCVAIPAFLAFERSPLFTDSKITNDVPHLFSPFLFPVPIPKTLSQTYVGNNAGKASVILCLLGTNPESGPPFALTYPHQDFGVLPLLRGNKKPGD